MPKHKKTRKQKQLADVRRHTETQTTHTATVDTHTPVREEHTIAPAPQAPRPQKHTSTYVIATSDYHYVIGDLRKTVILTTAIIVAEVLLKQFAGI